MENGQTIGQVKWTNDTIKASISKFLKLYQNRPIQDNQGGMKIPHAFATWFMLQQLNPKIVIESGVWKGQSTWLMENTLPQTQIYSLDINLSIREYISKSATYYEQDFTTVDWKHLDKDNTVLFFDDHQNALKRIRKGMEMGFKQFIFEDNYPAGDVGDCYSLKKAFQHAGYQPKKIKKTLKQQLKTLFKPTQDTGIVANSEDAQFLSQILDIYYEFPPVFKATKTRWGVDWNETNYPTPKPLYTELECSDLKIFQEEAQDYTWICYAKVR